MIHRNSYQKCKWQLISAGTMPCREILWKLKTQMDF